MHFGQLNIDKLNIICITPNKIFNRWIQQKESSNL